MARKAEGEGGGGSGFATFVEWPLKIGTGLHVFYTCFHFDFF